MSLNNALIVRSALKQHVERGCGAIEGRHRPLISNELKRSVDDSLDLDAATRQEHPEANRWDYIISVKGSERLIGIEPHSARDDEVSTVIAKKKQASGYLLGHLNDGWRVTAWIWVSSGKIRFSKMDPAIRRLNVNGIRFVSGVIKSFD